MKPGELISIQVVYALKTRQRVVELQLPPGTTARAAALCSELDLFFPDLALSTLPLGVFGERVSDDYEVQAGDRIELYRPLVLDPMEARRQRAARE